MSDFTALYLPKREPGKPDPSRSGFATTQEATDYMFTQICSTCKEQRRKFFASEQPHYDSDDWNPNIEPEEWPACTCEWLILPTDKVGAEDMWEAAGWTTVYTKPSETTTAPNT
jgi:hypothetical protein